MSNELAHALKWLPWADAGFPIPTHLYKNPYEMKREKHRPKPDIELEARKILGQKMES